MATTATLTQNPTGFGPAATIGAQGFPILVQTGTFDPTGTAENIVRPDGKNMVIPKGCRVLGVMNADGGATGGTNPTVDVGYTGDADAFANELDADGVTAFTVTGAGIGVVQTANRTVLGNVGASAATGGTVTVALMYTYDAGDLDDISGL